MVTAAAVLQTATRKLSRTESNWIAAVNSGTGITICSILFDRRIPQLEIEGAVEDLLARNPRLRSILVQGEDQFFFETPEQVSNIAISVVDRSSNNTTSHNGEEEEEVELKEELWRVIAEEAMNTPFPSTFPFPVLESKLFLLPESHCLLVLRIHAAAADMASTATVIKQIIGSLHKRLENSVDEGAETLGNGKVSNEEEFLPAMEDAIPSGQANKPFWAHGVDMVGYGLGSRRHAYLPFHDPDNPRCSKLISADLKTEATSLLLKECENRGVSLFGAINAAALKAVATLKQVGSRGEHYGTAVLLQCRHRLDPVIPESSVGFYHSCIMRTMHTTETVPFWDLAMQCARDVNEAIKNRKHFTDMGDLNTLMGQAMRFPNLTPNGSLRTTVLSMTFDPVADTVIPEEAEAVGAKNYLSCSSVHGVGPCLGIFSFMRQGSLHFSFVYPSPLLARSQMQNLVDSILFYLSGD